MKEKIKHILIGVLIGIIVLPTIAIGGNFVSSLIQGKTAEEAIQILAEQIDILIGRVEVVEKKQAKQQLWQEKEEVCGRVDELNRAIPSAPEGIQEGVWLGPKASSCQEWIQQDIEFQKRNYGQIIKKPLYPPSRPTYLGGIQYDTVEKLYNWTKDCPESPDLNVLKPAYEKYLQVKERCDELTAQYSAQ